MLAGSGYSAAETVPANWSLISATCDNGSPVTNISVAPNQTVTCTFVDQLKTGAILMHETVPAGYHVDANDKPVTVDNPATCLDNPYTGETVSFHNTPLTDLTVTVNSQIDGGTSSTVTCSPAGPSGSSGTNGDFSGTTPDLEPGAYTCTVVIDP